MKHTNSVYLNGHLDRELSVSSKTVGENAKQRLLKCVSALIRELRSLSFCALSTNHNSGSSGLQNVPSSLSTLKQLLRNCVLKMMDIKVEWEVIFVFLFNLEKSKF